MEPPPLDPSRKALLDACYVRACGHCTAALPPVRPPIQGDPQHMHLAGVARLAAALGGVARWVLRVEQYVTAAGDGGGGRSSGSTEVPGLANALAVPGPGPGPAPVLLQRVELDAVQVTHNPQSVWCRFTLPGWVRQATRDGNVFNVRAWLVPWPCGAPVGCSCAPEGLNAGECSGSKGQAAVRPACWCKDLATCRQNRGD